MGGFKMLKKAKENKKGFTLAELLIVVAIIAVLVAISIPIFNSQLEKSREAVDAANIRAAYAEITADALTGKTDTTKTITPKQTNAGWQTKFDFPEGLVTKTGRESTKIVNSTNVTLAWENNQVTVTCSLAQETK